MSAEILRKAAKALRERAQKSGIQSPGPWKSLHHGVQSDDGRWVCDVAMTLGKYEAEATTRHYIATMHPGVGLALAEWLDAVAQLWASAEDVVDLDGDPITFGESIDSHALPIARLILGGAS